MKKTNKLLSIILAILMIVTSVPFAFAAETPQTREIDGKTYYELDSADDLYWFAEYVNTGTYDANAILTADITVNENLMNKITLDAEGNAQINENETVREWISIGNSNSVHNGARFAGEFNGNGKVVSGIYLNTEATEGSFFGVLNSNAYVHDFTMRGSYICSGNAAGFVSSLTYGDNIRLENLINESTVRGWRAAGIVASAGAGGTIKNCVNKGTIYGDYDDYYGTGYREAGIVESSINDTKIINCYNVGDVEHAIGGDIDDGLIINCYYLDSASIGDVNTNWSESGAATAKTSEQFANGEVAYSLGEAFGQTIGTDVYPVLGGEKVYYGYTSCGDEVMIYTNNADDVTAEKPAHNWSNKDGICANDCGYACPHEKYTMGICDVCNYVCSHSFTEFNETVAPKCEETGWEESYCDYCNIRLEKEISALEHDWISGGFARPTQNIDGSWSDGYYYDTCKHDATHINKTGVAKRADYSAYDEANAKLQGYLNSVELTDAAVAEIQKSLAMTTMVPNNLIEGESSLVFMNNWVKSAEAIIAKIESGEYVKIDGANEYNKIVYALYEELTQKYGEEAVKGFETENSDEVVAKVSDIYKRAEALTGSVAENKEALEEIKADLEAIFAELEKCLDGTHSYGKGILTRPHFDTESKWVDGYYTYTCTVCGDEKTEAVERANISLCDELLNQVLNYRTDDTLTDEAREEIRQSYYNFRENHIEIIDNFGFIRIDLVADEQPIIDEATAELQEIINEIEAKIASGEYVKADYTEIDEAIAEIEQKLADENITDEGKAGLEEIKAQLEAMKADENTSASDLAELFADLKEYEATLGTCPDCGRPAHDDSFVQNLICMIVMLINLIKSMF